ncbi:MAG: hypothetical protein JWM73_2768 [Solirubrobacterales bacterium]|nr:hypothetical protein [Solirubrobacterales bacterium]
MRLRTAPLAVLAAAFAIAPAGAWAADRSATLSEEGAKYTWSSAVQTGAVYTSDVSDHAPACSPVFSCDTTLIQTDRYGNVQVEIAGKGVNDQDTLKDVDLHVYVSNADGAQGELIQESVGATADEATLLEDLPAGFYLVKVDWYLGVGSVDGAATLLAPTTETDTPPEFVPAEGATGPDTTPARSYDFSAADHATQSWTSGPGAGVSDAQDVIGCPAVNCDYTLIHVADAGILTLTTGTAVPTLVDADVHVLASNADGAEGEEVASATNFTPAETVVTEVDPGYYLMRVDYTGAGTYDGTAAWSEPAPEEEPAQ